MADTTDTAASTPAPVSVTLELPGRIVLYYDMLTEAGLYLSTPEALRQAVLNSYRFEKGSFHSLRIDTDPGEDKPAEEAEITDQEAGPKAEA